MAHSNIASWTQKNSKEHMGAFRNEHDPISLVNSLDTPLMQLQVQYFKVINSTKNLLQTNIYLMLLQRQFRESMENGVQESIKANQNLNSKNNLCQCF